METILYVTAEVVRQVAILAAPVMPAAAGKLLDGLGQSAGRAQLQGAGRGRAAEAGTAIPPPAGVFPRYVEPEAEGETRSQAKARRSRRRASLRRRSRQKDRARISATSSFDGLAGCVKSPRRT